MITSSVGNGVIGIDKPKPKYKVGEKVILLDFSNVEENYNWFWSKDYNKYIGKPLIIEFRKWDTYLDHTWFYLMKEFGSGSGFNEHWLAHYDPLRELDWLFEI